MKILFGVLLGLGSGFIAAQFLMALGTLIGKDAPAQPGFVIGFVMVINMGFCLTAVLRNKSVTATAILAFAFWLTTGLMIALFGEQVGASVGAMFGGIFETVLIRDS